MRHESVQMSMILEGLKTSRTDLLVVVRYKLPIGSTFLVPFAVCLILWLEDIVSHALVGAGGGARNGRQFRCLVTDAESKAVRE